MSENSKYKSFNVVRRSVKIFKYQNNRSAIDLSHLLTSYRKRGSGENNELEYAGRLCFSITSDGKYQRAYLEKSVAKALFESVINGTFTQYFKDGFRDFGGGQKDGKIFSKKLEISIHGKKIVFRIEEMPGQRTKTGAFKPVGRAYSTATSMLDPEDFLRMAIEGLDFIRAVEVVGMMRGLPLNTLTNLDYEAAQVNGIDGSGTNQTNSSTNNNNNNNNNNNIHSNQKPMQQMSSREFYDYYQKQKAFFETVQAEYNRRVAESNKNKN